MLVSISQDMDCERYARNTKQQDTKDGRHENRPMKCGPIANGLSCFEVRIDVVILCISLSPYFGIASVRIKLR